MKCPYCNQELPTKIMDTSSIIVEAATIPPIDDDAVEEYVGRLLEKIKKELLEIE